MYGGSIGPEGLGALRGRGAGRCSGGGGGTGSRGGWTEEFRPAAEAEARDPFHVLAGLVLGEVRRAATPSEAIVRRNKRSAMESVMPGMRR